MTRHRLLWPLLVLALLLLYNLFFTPNFFNIRIQDGHLFGTLIHILRYGSPLILVALGMTLVIATGGIDLSVGSVVAIGGALACLYISRQPDQNSLTAVLIAVALSLGVALLLGLWNGLLVARVGVQPIIATLILMVAGRGVAQLITGGQIITISSAPYDVIGSGYLLALPISVWLAGGVFALMALLARRTALGLLLESVGGNAEASRLAGIRASSLVVMVYVISAVCACVAGLILSSDVSAADGNNAGMWIELDAILAVVIGGTALTGGRFYLTGTVLGAVIIQTLSTTIHATGVPPETTLVYKAIVVMIVCLLQSPSFRARVFGRRRRRPEMGDQSQSETVEVPV